MNLLQIRQQFVELSGRYDLVIDTGDFADRGANFFINAGQRNLDRMSELGVTELELSLPLDADEYILNLARSARVISRVRIRTAADDEVTLKYKLLEEIQVIYGKNLAVLDAGSPLFWTTKVASASNPIRSLYIIPASTEDLTVIVYGQFMSGDLILETDETFWSTNHPDLLLKAALWQLEIFYRNTEGAKDWLRALQFELTLLDQDYVQDLVVNIQRMEG